jgi:UDP-N-acetylglucosamine 3-dehydrogenase
MLKVGVVGLGAMGQHHVRLYSQMSSTGLSSWNASEGSQGGIYPSIQLVGVADANVERAKEIGEKYQTCYYQDYHELLSIIDAVSIAVPTTLHHAIAVDFLNAGVHCLVEKPIASQIEEAENMIKAAAHNHVNLAIGHIERFNPAVLKLKKIIDEGTLGQLLILSTRRVGPSVPRIRDVGVIIDSATHDIGVVKHMIGKNPVCVYSRVGSLKHSKEDHAIIVLDFESATACIEVNWFTPHKVRTLVATGSEGIAYLDYIEQNVTVYTAKETKIIEIQKSEPLKLELEDFLKSIIDARNPAVDGKEGLEVLKIALEASSNNTYTSQLILHR